MKKAKLIILELPDGKTSFEIEGKRSEIVNTMLQAMKLDNTAATLILKAAVTYMRTFAKKYALSEKYFQPIDAEIAVLETEIEPTQKVPLKKRFEIITGGQGWCQSIANERCEELENEGCIITEIDVQIVQPFDSEGHTEESFAAIIKYEFPQQ